MSSGPDHTRRWLINGSSAVLTNALAGGSVRAQVSAGPPVKAAAEAEDAAADEPISPVTTALSEYVSKTLDRELPPAVVAKTKLHTLDTIAAMVSGSRLKAGEFAARYVDTLGGKPQATVFGTRHRDLRGQRRARQRHGGPWRRDRRFPSRRPIPSRLRHRAGGARDRGARRTQRQRRAARGRARLRHRRAGRSSHSASRSSTPNATRPTASRRRSAPQPPRRRCCGSIRARCATPSRFAAQQASGIPYWERDREHVEKAFDFGGMGARNGVTAATMVASGFTGVDDFMSGRRTCSPRSATRTPRPRSSRPSSVPASRSSIPRSRNGASARRCSRSSTR